MEIDEKEKKYLEKTYSCLDKEISTYQENCNKRIEDMIAYNKYHWESLSDMDETEEIASETLANTNSNLTNIALRKLRQLKAAERSPYFGKITLSYDGEIEDNYIGPTTIFDGNSDMVVTDWRSPVATVYYNSRFGKTSYKAPNGKIDCELLNRKQIKVKNKKIYRIIDSDIHLDDELLQETLAKSSNDKMKNIVSTIQEEQNDIIRNIIDKSIIVQGCAGSGKTSIGLHRLAYLLYNDPKVSSNNMLVFSPSDVFADYISSVLPELGEENAKQTTFNDFANSYIKGFDKIESYTEFVSKYYDGLYTDEENRFNKFVFSKEFMEAIDEFVIRKGNEYSFDDDLHVMNKIVPRDYLNKFIQSGDYKDKTLPEKYELLQEDIISTLYKYEHVGWDKIRNAIRIQMFKNINPRKLYNEFLKSDEFISRYGSKVKPTGVKFLSYSNLIGMLYLYLEMTGYSNNKSIHHVVIDEAQDYSPMQIKMIKNMLKGASITILGDANQTINPYHKYDSLEDMKEYLGRNTHYIELNKAYRSTKDIMDYSGSIIGEKIDSIRKVDNLPVKVKDVSKEKLFKELVKDIADLKEKGFERICIITRSKNETDAIFEGLKDDIENLTVINETEKKLKTNTLISPAYMAKGLEFDAVISYNDKDNPYGDKDRYLYYVACTRAQHNLLVYNEPTKIKKLGGR